TIATRVHQPLTFHKIAGQVDKNRLFSRRACKINHLATFCSPRRDTLPPGHCFGVYTISSVLIFNKESIPCHSHICFQDPTLIFGNGSYMVPAVEKIRTCSTTPMVNAAALAPSGKTARRLFVQNARCSSYAGTTL